MIPYSTTEYINMTDCLYPTVNRTRAIPGKLTLTVGPDRGDLRGADDIAGCTIERNEKVGILFRTESEQSPARQFRSPHRNIVELCQIRDNGCKAEGVGIDIRGPVRNLAIRDNSIEDSGEGKQKIGVRIGSEVRDITLAGNSFVGIENDTVQADSE